MVGGPHHYSHSYPRGSQPSIRHVCGLLQMGHEPSAPTTNHVGTPSPAVGVWIRLLPPWVYPRRFLCKERWSLTISVPLFSQSLLSQYPLSF